MYLKQFYLSCLSQASYLIGDKDAGVALVVDPTRDVDKYLDEAKAEGLSIKHVFLTHIHADFVSGHIELAEATGAKIYVGAKAACEFAFTPLDESFCLELGTSVVLKILETPGHTPESVSIVVYDLSQNSQIPHAVLTGDTLFVGDVGRPDLFADQGINASDLAGMLYDSLLEKLMQLPEQTLVYPAHGAGSLCGKSLGKENVSTIGQQRMSNWALQPMRKAEFVSNLTNDMPDAPPYFAFDSKTNKKQRPSLDKVLDKVLNKLFWEDLKSLKEAQLVDCREPGVFAEAHIDGAINIGLSGKFATWAGTVLSQEKPIVIICAPGKEKEAAIRLSRIGFDHILGFLEWQKDAVEEFAKADMRKYSRVDARELVQTLSSYDAPLVLDVRQDGERKQSAIETSMHIPLTKLAQSVEQIPRDRKIVVVCAGGYRSSIAASLLRNHGISDITDLTGGMSAWQDAIKAPNAVLPAILQAISPLVS